MNSMTPAEMKQLVRDHYAAMHRHDEAALERQVAADFVDHDSPVPVRGPEGVKSWSRALAAAFPDLSVELLDLIADGDRVAVRARWRGTHKGPFFGAEATGNAVDFTGMVFWRIAGGKIAERWANLDRATLMQQLGVR